MAPSFSNRIKHAWNAFTNDKVSRNMTYLDTGGSYGLRPDRVRLNLSNERSIISSIYTRIGIDISSVDIRHVRLDENNRYLSPIKSGLNDCLSLEANIDQSAQAFKQDVAMSLLDKGIVAIVPVETSLNPLNTASYDIKSLRVGEILTWYPKHVQVRVYNDLNGKKEDITLPKSLVCIIENPLYAVMNEPNSTLQRLIRKLNLLDAVDEQSSSGKLDLIIQLPYVIKSEARRLQAESRRKDMKLCWLENL